MRIGYSKKRIKGKKASVRVWIEGNGALKRRSKSEKRGFLVGVGGWTVLHWRLEKQPRKRPKSANYSGVLRLGSGENTSGRVRVHGESEEAIKRPIFSKEARLATFES